MQKHRMVTRRACLQTAVVAAGVSIASQVSDAADEKPAPTPLLDKLDGTPDADKLALVMRWLKQSNLQFFDELRAARPVMNIGDIWFVARYPDVVELLSHPTIFSVKLYLPKMGSFMLAHDEEPVNRRDKGFMSTMLPLSDSDAVRKMVAECAASALQEAGGKIDVVNQFGRWIPIRLVQSYFGLDGVELEALKRWSYWAQYDNFHNHPFHALPNAAEVSTTANAAKKELGEYAVALVQRRAGELAQNPQRDDVVSRMLLSKPPASVGFGIDRVVANAMGLLIGAVETTSHAIAHAIDELLQRPAELKSAIQLATADDFPKFSQVIWEANRFRPISSYMFRYCEEDYTIAKGTGRDSKIPKGATVIPLTQSAMFDAIEFTTPNAFVADRPDYQSFLFGFGHHRCLGEFIGRQMIPEAVRVLFTKNNVRRAEGPDGQLQFKGGPFPESLILEYDT